MNMARVDELWTRFLSEEALSSSEQRDLAGGLDGDGRERLRDDARIDGLLYALSFPDDQREGFVTHFRDRLEADRDRERFVAGIEPRIRAQKADRMRRNRMVWLAAAAVVVVGSLGVIRGRRQMPVAEAPAGRLADSQIPRLAPPRLAPVAVLARIEGRVLVIDGQRRAPMEPGSTVEGRGLATIGPRSEAEVRYPDGTTLTFTSEAVVTTFEAARVVMPTGRVRAQGTRRLAFASPHADVTAVGARFTMAVNVTETRVRVEEGTVSLQRRGQRLEMKAGQEATAVEGRPMALTTGPRVATLLVGGAGPDATEELMRARLERMGFDVRVRVSGPPFDPEIRSSALLVITSSVLNPGIEETFRHLPIPILVWASNLYDELAMTNRSPEDQGSKVITSRLVINAPSHPLAAGLGGEVRVSAGKHHVRWGSPSPFAHWVATVPDEPTRAMVFGYDRGVPMIGMDAPARRTGLFISSWVIPDLSAAGWQLVEAAIRWTAE